jgi:anti-anti-sigma factor
MTVSITTGREDGKVSVIASGEIDLSNSALLADAISGALKHSGAGAVEVDLTSVTFLDSSGIAALLKGRRVADDIGIAYRIGGMHGVVRQVLELTGVLDYLTGASD